MKRRPNESIKIVNFRIEYCKTAARRRFPCIPGLTGRQNGTFSKKCAKPEREAKTQRATKQLTPQSMGSTRGGLEGKAGTQGSRRRSREGGFGGGGLREGVPGKRILGGGVVEEVTRRRCQGHVFKDTSRHSGSHGQFFRTGKNPNFAGFIFGEILKKTMNTREYDEYYGK